jgi:hypothetical protein
MLFFFLAVFALPNTGYSQDKRALKAAELSFDEAETDYKKGKNSDAAQKYTIVVNSIPATVDSKKHLEMRLESLIKLVDIYFYKHINFQQACENLDLYISTMNTIRNSGVLKGSSLVEYLKKEQAFANKEVKQCEAYKSVGGDMNKFRQIFEKEFNK